LTTRTKGEYNNQNTFSVSILEGRVAYTLAELEKATGAKRRALQFWTEAGVILAEKDTERAGRGVHRRYTQDEAAIACVVRAFAQLHLSIGELKAVSNIIRDGLQNENSRSTIESAIAGKRCVYLIFQKAPESTFAWSLTIISEPIDRTMTRDFKQSLTEAIQLLHNDNSFVSIILLNTYVKGLSQ
jgi:DNA-binding transcriptional MerR regulator